jgi:hypothetical protein
MFYVAVAVAMAAGGELEQASDLIGQARTADATQVSAWINELAEIGRQHPAVLQLIPVLTAPAGQPHQEASDDGT